MTPPSSTSSPTTPPNSPPNIVVIAIDSSPSSASAITFNIESSNNANPKRITTEIVQTSRDPTDEQSDSKGNTATQRSRNQLFEDPSIKRASAQFFEIVAGANPIMSDYSGFSANNPQFSPDSDRSAQPQRTQSTSFLTRPVISGTLTTPDNSLDDQSSRNNNSLLGLIGKEPLYIASALISAGSVWWMARGLALATALIMGTPAWRQVDFLPVVLRSSKGFEREGTKLEGDQGTQLETIATTSFFNAEDGHLEEEAVGSLFEIPEKSAKI